jgi:hypothetical protein
MRDTEQQLSDLRAEHRRVNAQLAKAQAAAGAGSGDDEFAAQQELQLQLQQQEQVVAELRSELAQLRQGPAATDGDSSSNELELLRFENELLRGDLDRLKALECTTSPAGATTANNSSGNSSLVRLQPVLQQLSGVLEEFPACDVDAAAAGQLSAALSGRDGPVTDAAVEQLLQAVAASHEKLQSVTEKAQGLLQHLAAAAPQQQDLQLLLDDSAGAESSEAAAAAVQLQVLLSGLVTLLSAKFQQLNEVQCDRLLAQAAAASNAAAAGSAVPVTNGVLGALQQQQQQQAAGGGACTGSRRWHAQHVCKVCGANCRRGWSALSYTPAAPTPPAAANAPSTASSAAAGEAAGVGRCGHSSWRCAWAGWSGWWISCSQSQRAGGVVRSEGD